MFLAPHLLSIATSPTGSPLAPAEMLDWLRPHYPPLHCPLVYQTPLDLLVAVILLPQSTAEQVNAITPALFATYPTPAAYCAARRQDLARLLHPIPFFRHKARYIQESCRILEERYNGQLPRHGHELTQLPGVARKGTNLLMGTLWDEPIGITVNTHVQRVATRLGWSDGRNAVKVENDLLAITPAPLWREMGYYLHQHGRHQCHLQDPACTTCPLRTHCPTAT